MKKNRQFYIVRCPDCGCVDGSIEITDSYDSTRDRENWAAENRTISIYTQEKLGQFPDRCVCDMLDQPEEEED